MIQMGGKAGGEHDRDWKGNAITEIIRQGEKDGVVKQIQKRIIGPPLQWEAQMTEG